VREKQAFDYLLSRSLLRFVLANTLLIRGRSVSKVKGTIFSVKERL